VASGHLWPRSQALRRVCHCLIQTVMVSVGVSVLGVTGLHFVNPGIKINGKYWKNCFQTCATFPNTLSFSRTACQLILLTKQLIFFWLKHQLSSHQHSGYLRIWIWLIIKSGRYFRSMCTRWRSTMLTSCTSISRLSGNNLTSVLLTRLSSGAPA